MSSFFRYIRKLIGLESSNEVENRTMRPWLSPESVGVFIDGGTKEIQTGIPDGYSRST